MAELPRVVKHATVWLVLGTALFLALQAWQAGERDSRVTLDGGTVQIRRSPDGHFHWPGTVNGRPVDFLVDTGATRTALPAALAEGLRAEGAVQSNTAGGTVRGHTVRVDLQLRGGLRAQSLPVTVLPSLAAPLLGMDVLSRLHFSQADGVLTLQMGRR